MAQRVVNPLFTSDTHVWHETLVKSGFRQHGDVLDMNESLINGWNRKVGKNDTLFFLGDLTWRRSKTAIEVLRRLQGRVIWVPGNHDHEEQKIANELGWQLAQPIHEIDVVDGDNLQRIVLCHYPMLIWNKVRYGAWHLHGHSHGSCKYPYDNHIMDVGADTNGYSPYSYAEVKDHMKSKKIAVIDHHGEP